MAKQIIRLTESDLHRIVKNSVKKVIKESVDREELSSLISSTKENIKAIINIGRKHVDSFDEETRRDLMDFMSYLHFVDLDGIEGCEDWYYQEHPGRIANEDDYDWFNIAADGYTSPEEKEERFINRFGNPDDQDEYYTWDKYNSDVDAAWNEHDKQLNNSNRSFKNALKSADKRPLYRKNSPNNDIPKRKRVFR